MTCKWPFSPHAKSVHQLLAVSVLKWLHTSYFLKMKSCFEWMDLKLWCCTPLAQVKVQSTEVWATVENRQSCLFILLLQSLHNHLHLPAVSSDEGPYSKGTKETTDQSHSSRGRSLSGTLQSNPCFVSSVIWVTILLGPQDEKISCHLSWILNYVPPAICFIFWFYKCLDRLEKMHLWHTCHGY